MKTIEFYNKVKTIVQNDKRYSEDAYEFVNDAVIFTVEKSRKQPNSEGKHISGKELLNGVVEYALKEFGPLAHEVLSTWGINDGVAVGNIVFNMVEHHILSTSKEDSIEDFKNYPEFKEVLSKPFSPRSDTGKHIIPVIA